MQFMKMNFKKQLCFGRTTFQIWIFFHGIQIQEIKILFIIIVEFLIPVPYYVNSISAYSSNKQTFAPVHSRFIPALFTIISL